MQIGRDVIVGPFFVEAIVDARHRLIPDGLPGKRGLYGLNLTVYPAPDEIFFVTADPLVDLVRAEHQAGQ
jgi:hypothetical protein